jgi:hypothetical protein
MLAQTLKLTLQFILTKLNVIVDSTSATSFANLANGMCLPQTLQCGQNDLDND